MSERPKRLIEVAFPLEEVSAHSRPEKYAPPGHISTLHRWWARRPLAACRAFIYALLVDDPESDAEREALLKEVADLASWNAVRHPEKVVRQRDSGGSGLTGTQLLERARQRILNSNGQRPPTLLDPFAGGGAIPLEGLRLGCDVTAGDLNPVAILTLKGTVEYPQKFGQPDSRPAPSYILHDKTGSQPRLANQGLATSYLRNPLSADVRYWGLWVLERAREELTQFYPVDSDGSVPMAYLWSRTIPCPSCDGEVPLIRQYWLARKPRRKVALRPFIDWATKRIDFEVVEGQHISSNLEEVVNRRGDTRCLMCSQVIKAADARNLAKMGKMTASMTGIVLEGKGKMGKRYRADSPLDLTACTAAAERLQVLLDEHVGESSLVPAEPIDPKTLGLRVDAFGLADWGALFNARQLLALITFSRLVADAHNRMLESGMDVEYANAIATYLGLVVDRLAEHNCTLTRWEVTSENLKGIFDRQTLSLVWDYPEAVPIGERVGSWISLLTGQLRSIDAAVVNKTPPVVAHVDAAQSQASATVVVTDPPYYNAIDYAGLSDFFFVWLKRSIGFIHPELLSMPLTPKRQQAIMASETKNPIERERYVGIMAGAFHSMAQSLAPNGLVGVVFAHSDPDAWATLVEGLLSSGLIPDASWPIDTEMQSKVSGGSRANLQTSVWMACRKREGGSEAAFLSDVLAEMRPIIRERLLYFWSKGIRGADFFISAIGPALSVFGRYERVLRPDGSEVSVRDFLDIVRRESTDVALEQVLHGADLGVIDPLTRHYVTWVWSYSKAALDAGEVIALSLATGASYDDTTRHGSIAVEAREKNNKKIVRLRMIRQRATEDEEFGYGTPARPVPLIDQLQYAAWLWGENRTDALGSYRGSLGETRWAALHTLGQAVAECLPDGDEDRRIILGLLSSNVVAARAASSGRSQPGLPGF